MKPLNPALYNAMVAVFGRHNVRISSPGVRMQGTYLPGPDGRQRFTPISKGEYYVTNCPYCGDMKKRLWVNHSWGIKDRKTGDRRYWLACCFNQDCLSKGDNLDDLKETLSDYRFGADADRVRVPEPQVASGPLLRPVKLPDDFVLLSDLKRGHPARRYVRSRGFHPDLLARDWGVGFSPKEACCLSKCGRLVIPLRAQLPEHGWSIVGWQARAIDPNEVPKYFTRPGTPKSSLLYGLERISKGNGPVVICEGVTDVWRADCNAVAVLGHHVSGDQVKLLRKHLAKRPLVLMLDPDAADEAAGQADKIRAALRLSLSGQHPESRVVIASLPDERDPGDCTSAEIWTAAWEALTPGKMQKQR